MDNLIRQILKIPVINDLNRRLLKFSLNKENKSIKRIYDSLLPKSWH